MSDVKIYETNAMEYCLQQRLEYLNQFDNLVTQLSGCSLLDIEKIADDIISITPTDEYYSQEQYAFLALTHGNEWAGIAVFVEFLNAVINNKIIIKHKIFLIVGNREAYIRNVRFIDQDLNRSYGYSKMEFNHESQRVVAIKRALSQCDYSIDFHQTVEPTSSPFFIVPHVERIVDWVKSIRIDLPIVLSKLKSEPTTSSSYLAINNKMGVTVELGDFGFGSDQINLGFNVIKNVLNIQDENSAILQYNEFEFAFFKENNKDSVYFDPSLKNLDYVTENQILGTINGGELKAEKAGYILLYPMNMINNQNVPAEGIYCLLKKSVL